MKFSFNTYEKYIEVDIAGVVAGAEEKSCTKH